MAAMGNDIEFTLSAICGHSSAWVGEPKADAHTFRQGRPNKYSYRNIKQLQRRDVGITIWQIEHNY